MLNDIVVWREIDGQKFLDEANPFSEITIVDNVGTNKTKLESL